jgi:hypothetical protein
MDIGSDGEEHGRWGDNHSQDNGRIAPLPG